MDLSDAKRIIRGERASGKLYVEDFQGYVQEQWLGSGVKDTWQDDAWHGVWWTLQALQSGDKKALECGKAYLELAMRERG